MPKIEGYSRNKRRENKKGIVRAWKADNPEITRVVGLEVRKIDHPDQFKNGSAYRIYSKTGSQGWGTHEFGVYYDQNEAIQEATQILRDLNPGNSLVLIETTKKLPKFLGPDKEIYGPYEDGERAKVSRQVAELLKDKNRAKIIREV